MLPNFYQACVCPALHTGRCSSSTAFFFKGRSRHVKQTRGSRMQPINGSQNEWIEVKLNEQNANSCLLPTQNLTAGLWPKVHRKQIFPQILFKALFLHSQRVQKVIIKNCLLVLMEQIYKCYLRPFSFCHRHLCFYPRESSSSFLPHPPCRQMSKYFIPVSS